MTAYTPAFSLPYDTTPTVLADNSSPGTSRSHYNDPSPTYPPYHEPERHPRSIRPVQLSTEFLLKPQSQSHSGLAPHFLSFAALRRKAEGLNSTHDKLEEESTPQNVDSWLTTSDSMNVQDNQIHEASTGHSGEFLGSVETGDYFPPVVFNPSVLPPPPMPLPPLPEYLYGNHCLIPQAVHVPRAAAHQPVPPEQHSTYSELAPHLEFMEKMQQQQHGYAPVDTSPRKARQTGRVSPPARDQRQSTFPNPIDRSRRPDHRSGSSKNQGRTVDHPTASKLSKSRRTPFPTPPPEHERIQEESSESSEVGSTSSRNRKEPKRPSLACSFCRERKIACDRWTQGGLDSDIPCTACALRSFECVFVQKTSKAANQAKRT